jgi:hypothetical protein
MFKVAKRSFFFIYIEKLDSPFYPFSLHIRRTLHPLVSIFVPCYPETLGEREREREREREGRRK